MNTMKSKNRITKLEVLWTRGCNLKCGYCAMVYDGKNPNKPKKIKKNWEEWKLGLQRMKDLGCGFMAVYGSEPLTDMEYLPEFFEETNKLGILHTLITNCTVPNTKEKLTMLVEHGLNSLTVSFDGDESELNDRSSTAKSGKGLETARWFKKEFGDKVRDVSVVFTLTKTNLDSILKWIPKLSEEGIYVFFDLIHNDIGNPGTKVKNCGNIDDLIFHNGDEHLLKDFGVKLRELKNNPLYASYVHQDNSFIDVLVNTPEVYINKMWNCAAKEYEGIFPSWLTIEQDGTARVCDDFHIEHGKNWKFWDLTPEIFDGEFTEYWTETTRRECKGCFWNTHFCSHMIKMGVETFDNYVNNQNTFNNWK